MIVSLLWGLAATILDGVFGLAPTFTLDKLGGVGDSIGSAVATVNGIFPIVWLGGCIAAAVATWAFVALWELAVYVYKLVPFKAT